MFRDDCIAQSISQLPRWKGVGYSVLRRLSLLCPCSWLAFLSPLNLSASLCQRLHLCDKLHDTTGLLDLALSILAEVAGANDQRDLRDAALAKHLAVAEGEEVENGCGVAAALLGEVLLALLEGNQRPELQVCVSLGGDLKSS